MKKLTKYLVIAIIPLGVALSGGPTYTQPGNQQDRVPVLSTMRQRTDGPGACPGIITVLDGPYQGMEFEYDHETSRYKLAKKRGNCKDLRSQQSFVPGSTLY